MIRSYCCSDVSKWPKLVKMSSSSKYVGTYLTFINNIYMLVYLYVNISTTCVLYHCIPVYTLIHLYTIYLYMYILLYSILILTSFRWPAGSLWPSLPLITKFEPHAAIHPHERHAECQALRPAHGFPEHHEEGHKTVDQQLLQNQQHLHVYRFLHVVHQGYSHEPSCDLYMLIFLS